MIVMNVCINDSNYWVMLSTHELMDQYKVNVDVGNGCVRIRTGRTYFLTSVVAMQSCPRVNKALGQIEGQHNSWLTLL
jgi:hypothetical protein